MQKTKTSRVLDNIDFQLEKDAEAEEEFMTHEERTGKVRRDFLMKILKVMN